MSGSGSSGSAAGRRLYVDLDDVLCQTARAFLGLLKRRYGRSLELEDLTEFDLGRTLGLEPDALDAFLAEVHAPEVMGELDPVPGALETLRSWDRQGWEIVVVTGRPLTVRDLSEAWLERHEVPHHGLLFVDKYGHSGSWTGDEAALALADLASHGFAVAIEDALSMARFLATDLGTRVLLLDRPWNRSDEVPAGSRSPVERCRDWQEIADRVAPPPGGARPGPGGRTTGGPRA